jgi:hypothetical protein
MINKVFGRYQGRGNIICGTYKFYTVSMLARLLGPRE